MIVPVASTKDLQFEGANKFIDLVCALHAPDRSINLHAGTGIDDHPRIPPWTNSLPNV